MSGRGESGGFIINGREDSVLDLDDLPTRREQNGTEEDLEGWADAEPQTPRESLAERSSLQRNVTIAEEVLNPYTQGFFGTSISVKLNEVFHMAVFGIIGVLVRIGLGLLFGPQHGNVTSDDSALFVYLPVNAVGSFFMGVAVGTDDAIQPYLPYVHLGFTTGLCGSLTTYASWNQQLLEMFARGNDGTNQWLRALFALILGLEVPLFSYTLGLHTEKSIRHFVIRYVRAPRDPDLADRYEQYRAARRSLSMLEEAAATAAALRGGHDRWGLRKPDKPPGGDDDIVFHRRRCIATVASGALAVAMVALAAIGVALDPDQTRKGYWLACVMAPFGVMIRWQLGLYLNRRHRWLPLGTFAANVLGSVGDAAVYGARLRRNSYWTEVVYQGVVNGIDGSMSTISTFVAELQREWRLRYAYAYATISVTTTLMLGFLIYGVQKWTL
ncbi:hypothetical protein CDCA_CDCA04G1285 [Cyanidium caldarium]|uniref:Uncharacterized protein n=1 Tax=Cyanidium caldarium TaxID=2771 RepID=A0AAV9IT34_CYACA|nr:hypothetical protein CDCA_CDCA04G1285 [Cyanidium caldarium]